MQCAGVRAHALPVTAGPNPRGDSRRERSTGGGSGQRQKFDAPKRLIGTAAPAQEGAAARESTVYSLRLSTGVRRGSALSEPGAGVLVCLVGRDGEAFLHRVTPLSDPEQQAEEVAEICKVVGTEAGANCSDAVAPPPQQQAAAAASSSSARPVKPRFQEGSVDEVAFLGPELGPLAAVMVAPEGGSWVCDEVDVSSSRSGHTDRFVCREALGERADKAAAYLTPVPQGAVVYGSGEAAMVLSREEAAQLHSLNMDQYAKLKSRMLGTTAALVALGGSTALALGGPDAALPFMMGGCIGVVYQVVLQGGVDAVGASSAAYYSPQKVQPGMGLRLRLALANPGVRLLATAGTLVAALAAMHALHAAQGGEPLDRAQQLRYGLLALAGYQCNKLALLGVAGAAPQGGGDLRGVSSPQGDRADRVE